MVFTTGAPMRAMLISLVGLIASGSSVHQPLSTQSAHVDDRRGAESAALRIEGLRYGYNLDYDRAIATFREAIAADPAHPASYRLLAATVWIHLLFEQGAVTAEDYLGQARSHLRRLPASPELDDLFHEHLNRALALANERCRQDCQDADAHFQVGAAYGFQASYAATIEGKMFDSLRAARRAYGEHQRVLDLDPGRKEAGLIVGMYRYGVSTLSLPSRMFAWLAGFAGGRERGLRMIEDAASTPSDVQTNARFTLIVIYNREARYDDALRVIGELQREYPRNRLLWLEAGCTALRAGRPDKARAALEEGLTRFATDARPRAFGELARWRYYHGVALVALDRAEEADRELRAALTNPARPWVHGRVHIELGKLADVARDRSRATDAYRLAARLCGGDENDDVCVGEAKALMKKAYR